MTWEEYRQWCLTKREGPTSAMAMGLAGEIGETIDAVKKRIFHHRTDQKAKVLEEAGDAFFYYTMILHDEGLTLQEVIDFNVRKLNARYPGGFVPGGGIR